MDRIVPWPSDPPLKVHGSRDNLLMAVRQVGSADKIARSPHPLEMLPESYDTDLITVR